MEKQKVSNRLSEAERLVLIRQSNLHRLEGAHSEHRLNPVAEVNQRLYINDSFATNLDLTFSSMEKMEQPVVWIVGGVDKGNDYSMIQELVKDKVRVIVCLGSDNTKLFKAFQFVVPMMIVDAVTVAEAVQLATLASKEGDAVLFSPACSSHNMFKNLEDRGEQFIQSINNLKQADSE